MDKFEDIFSQFEDKKEDNEDCEHNLNNDNVCILCGLCKQTLNIKQTNMEQYNVSSDSFFIPSTFISGYNKNIQTLHLWLNNDNRKNFVKKVEVCLKRLQKKYTYGLKTRSKIKEGILIYFIYYFCKNYNKHIDLINLLNDSGISIEHFNKATNKIKNITKEFNINEIYIPVDLINIQNILKKHNINITNDFIINIYSENYYKYGKTLKKNIMKIILYKYIIDNHKDNKILEDFHITFKISKNKISEYI
jgi:hypothetical protein